MTNVRKHIVLSKFYNNEKYSSKNRDISQKEIPCRDRNTHAENLFKQYNEVLESHDERKKKSHIKDDIGIYVEIVSEPNFSLPLDSLDTNSFQLRNIKRIENKDIVVVFIPEKKRKEFIKKVEQYKKENNPKKNTPKNQNLIAPIKEIRLANLKSFWMDDDELYPTDPNKSMWWELWLKKNKGQNNPSELADKLSNDLGAELGNTSLSFFGNTVVLIKASASQLQSSLELIANLEELREAKETPSIFINMSAREHKEWAEDLASRVLVDNKNKVLVTVLDSGINYNNPLISKCCGEEKAAAWNPDWSLYDSMENGRGNDHGSRQAGLILFGDLCDTLLNRDQIVLGYEIESGRILPPTEDNVPELYGAITTGTAAKLEISAPEYSRVYSLAITSGERDNDGQPSSWSSAIDLFSAGSEDQQQRLFVVSVGNNQEIKGDVDYWDQIYLAKIEDPAQAWNALAVGAYTEKTTNDAVPDMALFARCGDLSPATRSSVNWGWRKQAPLKPDVVAEGGNRLLTSDGFVTNDDVVSVLTTSGRAEGQLFEVSRDTSAACALISRMASILMSDYPNYWPETVRALIVHSAEWTSTMHQRFEKLKKDSTPGQAKEVMLRCAGYGVPNIERARYSANHQLTLISQNSLTPFIREKNDPKFNEMQFYTLPWPVEALRELPDTLQVKLRVTLSYFIEPNPGKRGYRRRYSYQSHGLRFKVINPGQSLENFKASINKEALEDVEDYSQPEGDSSGWFLGAKMRTRGSLHSDLWEGAAADLLEMNCIAVYPVAGWWKNKVAEERWKKSVRYSLIVSIYVPDVDVDIYSEVENLINVETEVDASPISIEIPS